MPYESINYSNLIKFINQYTEKKSNVFISPQSVHITADNIISGFISEYNRYEETGEWKQKYDILEANIFKTQGCLIICRDEQTSKINAVLLANSERATRSLLLSLSGNIEINILYYEKWIEKIIKEYIYITEHTSDYSILGIKRSYQNISFDNKLLISNNQFNNLIITSKKDSSLVEFKELNTLKNRIEKEKYIIEGIRLVKRALQEGQPIDKIIYIAENQKDEDIVIINKLAKESKIPSYLITAGLMGSVTDTRPIPPILASAHIAIRDIDTMHITDDMAILILDNVSNPDNLGMVIRTADASGIDAIVLIGGTTHYLNKNVIRAARGAIGRIPIFTCTDETKFFDYLATKEFQILGMSSRVSNEKFYTTVFQKRTAFILGNETTGIREEISEKCTENIKIPMAPGQSSLNVGVAAGVVLYEYVRRKFLERTVDK